MSQLGFYYNVDRCSGCKTCQIACKDTWDHAVGVLNRKVHPVEIGSFPTPQAYFVSLPCNHCDEPACVNNCPTGAMFKDEESGRVLNNSDECIRCETCVSVCPYEAPTLDVDDDRIAKCDLCKELIEGGEEPACVASCLMRTIEYGNIDELRAKYGSNAEIPGIADSKATKPNIIIAPHRSID